jgi:iron complex outermembrane recepter protein
MSSVNDTYPLGMAVVAVKIAPIPLLNRLCALITKSALTLPCRCFVVVLALGVFTNPLIVLGNTADPGNGESFALDEVVVSASRVGELSLQKIPMAISVISPADLDAKGLGGVSDFVKTLPSVNMQSLSPGENDIEMRGLVTDGVEPTNAQERSLVAIYLDDAAITQQAFNPDLHVYDLERIEVLRGPQGTLYGAGSMAGTIRLITKKPDTKTFSGDGDLSVSQTEHGSTDYSIRGVINLPLIEDKLAARIALYRSEDSGYIDNIELNQRDSNPDYATQARIAVRWLPTEALTIDVSATFARLNALGRNAIFPQLGNYSYSSLTPEQFSDDFKLYNLTADWDLSFAHLISSTTAIQRHFAENETSEYFTQSYLLPDYQLPSNSNSSNDVHEFQEELRLVSRPDQALRWITGAYFERQTRFYPQTIATPGFDTAYGAEIGDPTFNSQSLYGTPAPDDIFYGTIRLKERQFALFGEATYPILPRLDLTVGLRYFNFHDDFDLYFTGVAGSIAPGTPDTGSGSQESSGANPRAVLSYTVSDDVMVYGEAARGFRYGGVNEPVPVAFCGAGAPQSFGPDSLWSYTLGEKGKFIDGRLTFDLDAFYIDWRNVQTIHNLECTYYYAENQGRVKSQGLELESKLRLTSELTLGLSGSFTDATANGAIPNVGAVDGDRTPYFPRVIVALNATYGIPLPGGKLVTSADYTWRSSAFTQFSPEDPLYREIPASKVLNASIGYDTGRWSVSIYGTNLTNDEEVSIIEPNTYGPVQPGDVWFRGRPRTIGVHLHTSF